MTDYNVAAQIPRYVYKKRDTLFAWVIALMFVAFYDLILCSTLGLASTVFMAALYSATAVYIKLGGKTLKSGRLFLALGLILALSFVFTDNIYTKTVVFMFDCLLYLIWLLYACGNNAENRLDMLWYDGIKAMFVMPFASLGRLFGAIFKCEKSKNRGIRLLMIIGGVLIAVVPTMIVVILLSGADSVFRSVLRTMDIRHFVMFEVMPRGFVCLCFAPPVFGAIYANAVGLHKNVLSKEKNEETRRNMAKLPSTLVYAAATPMLAVYTLFFVLQFRYFTSAFASVLPEGVDKYADYARNGFFELCAVAVINAAVILFVSAFTKTENGKKPLGARVYCGIYAVASIAFSCIGLSKMALYIEKFGLTRLRFNTALFMTALCVLFILAVIRQINLRMCFMKYACATICLFAVVFAFCRSDRIIADYNVNGYLDGRLAEVDVDMLKGLSYDSYPSLERLAANAGDIEVRHVAQEALEYMQSMNAGGRVIDFNFSRGIINQ